MDPYNSLRVASYVIFIGLWFAIQTDSIQKLNTISAVGDNKLTCPKEDPTEYIAAVVEYKPMPIGNQSPLEAVLSNTREYVKIIEDASVQNADIIVFPEYGLTTVALPPQGERARDFFVTLPELGSIPCDDDETSNKSRVLYELSCAAKRHTIYVVVNLGEIQLCTEDADPNCPSDGGYHYNTNVVFDRNGALIARYRKYHLYFEPQFDYPPLEHVTFKTDFGVEFGLFTCFDIIFAHPAVDLIASRGIRNFVFPTAWVDELPFLTAIQSQSLWAQSNHANLLASGYHQPDRGSMGSGIYSGHEGALDYVFNSSSGTKLVTSPVPIIPDRIGSVKARRKPLQNYFPIIEQDTKHFWLREDLSNCSFKTIDPLSTKNTICYEDKFCCDLEYQLRYNTHAIGEMKLIIFDGKRTVAAKRDWFEWQVCAVVHCLNEMHASCTENSNISINNHPIFENISIQMRPLKLEYEADGISQPGLSLLDTSFNLIPHTYFEINQWKDAENGMDNVQANNRNTTNLADIQVKTVALIHKVYNGRM